jgi:hypothetical protein
MPSSRAFIPGCYPTHNPSLTMDDMDDMDDIDQWNSRPAIEVNSIDQVNSSICGRIGYSYSKGSHHNDNQNWRLQETLTQTRRFQIFCILVLFYTYSPNSPSHITTLLWWSERKNHCGLSSTFAKVLITHCI